MNVMNRMDSGKHARLKKEIHDEMLLQLAAKKADKKALANLQNAEQFLEDLAKNTKALPVIDKKIYIETLQEGFGDMISSEDIISIRFKQYDQTGTLLKDTDEDAFTVALSKMIKGFKLGMNGARVGERRKIYIHPDLGFGKISFGHPPNELLIYEVVIVDKVFTSEEYTSN